MEEEVVEQKILFYFDEPTEYNYSKVYTCSSYLVYVSPNQKNFIKEVNEINVNLYTSCIHNQWTKFKKGTIFISNKEYKILDFQLYFYFYIDYKIYNRIGICKVDKETFFEIIKLSKYSKNPEYDS